MSPHRVRVGLRVRDVDLGDGTVVEVVGWSGVCAMIRFDHRPAFDYNGGNNPCLRLAETFAPLEEEC